MALAPVWHRLLFGPFSSMLQRGAQVYDLLDEVRNDDEDAYKALKKELAHTGKLPPSTLQVAAMAFIGWYLFFELCLVVALVKDYQLVWEPQWQDEGNDDDPQMSKSGFSGTLFKNTEGKSC